MLKEAVIKNETLSQENSSLNSTVEKGSELIVVNPKVEAYKIKSSGKEVLTEKGSRADQIKVCFTIAENKIAKEQEKVYYIQIIDSKNNVLGDKKTVTYGELILTYSMESKVNFKNKTLNVCEAVVNKDGFEKGSYNINIFDGSVLVSSSALTLK